MLIDVCGIACERCPLMQKGICPNSNTGCLPKKGMMYQIVTSAFSKNVELCFECADFLCKNIAKGPINFGYCQYISVKTESAQ